MEAVMDTETEESTPTYTTLTRVEALIEGIHDGKCQRCAIRDIDKEIGREIGRVQDATLDEVKGVAIDAIREAAETFGYEPEDEAIESLQMKVSRAIDHVRR